MISDFQFKCLLLYARFRNWLSRESDSFWIVYALLHILREDPRSFELSVRRVDVDPRRPHEVVVTISLTSEAVLESFEMKKPVVICIRPDDMWLEVGDQELHLVGAEKAVLMFVVSQWLRA